MAAIGTGRRLCVGVALLLVPVLAAWADDEPEPDSSGTVFIEDLDKALSRARSEKKLVFVYLALAEPDDQAKAIEHQVFRAHGSSAISEHAVAVKLALAPPYDKKQAALLRRYGVMSVPRFLILAPDRALMTKNVEPSVEAILYALATSAEAMERWKHLEVEWKKAPDRETVLRLAMAYQARTEWKKARSVLRKLVKREGRIEDRLELLSVLRHSGPNKQRAALLDDLMEAYPDHPSWMEWRIEAGVIDIDPIPVTHDGLLKTLPRQIEVLRGLATQTTEAARLVTIHQALAHAYLRLGEREGLLEQCAIIREKLEALPDRPDLRRTLGTMFKDAEAYDEAKKEFERVVAEHATSEEAPGALYDLALMYYGIARTRKDPLKGIEDNAEALKYLLMIETDYPASPWVKWASERLGPAIEQLIREQLDADRANLPPRNPSGGK